MATTVAFGSNLVVDEGGGNVYLVVNRTGDLTGTTLVVVDEDWSRSSAETDDVIFNPYVAGASIVYLPDTRQVLLKFNPGVKTLKIPYSISNDIVSELSERLYFSLSYITPVIIGDDDANIKINASDPVLSIHGLWVDEGQTTNSYIELSHAVNFAVTVKVSTYFGTYKQANYLGEGKDYKGLVDQLVTIPAGQTKAYVPFLTYQNDDPNDWKYESTEIRIEATSIPNGVLAGQISDVVTIIDVATPPPPPTLPILTLYDGGLAFENESTHSYAELSDPVDHDVTFKVSTYFGTYQQANYLGEAGDYDGLIDKLFTIQAGQTRVDIPVQINQNPDPEDWEYEAFELRIEAPTVFGATLGVGSVIINIKDVSTWVEPPPPTVTPLTATMLESHKQAFLNLESEVGTSSAVAIIAGNKELSNVGKTLDVFGLLSSGVKNAITWFAGSSAYANQEELPLFTLTQKQINIGLRLQSRVDSDQVATDPIDWTTEEVNDTDGLGLRVGDYVDGRVVIAQPLISLSYADHDWYVSQGMSDGTGDMISHFTKNIINHLGEKSVGIAEVAIDYSLRDKWLAESGTETYFYAQAPGKIISIADNTTGEGPGSFGNSITILLDKPAKINGGDYQVYVTYAHAKAGSIISTTGPDSVGDHVDVGTPLGIVGNSGFAIGKHIHATYATGYYEPDGYKIASNVGNISKSDPLDSPREGGVSISPVYIIGFNPSQNGFPSGPNPNVEPSQLGYKPFGASGNFIVPDNVIMGTDGKDYFSGTDSDTVYYGGDHYDDQIDYVGIGSWRSNFAVTQNPDSSINLDSAKFGFDILKDVEGVWFEGEWKWYTKADLLKPLNTNVVLGKETGDVLYGSSDIDMFAGGAGNDHFVGSIGNDVYNGGDGDDTVEYYGAYASRDNFVFTQNPNGTITAKSDYFGTETYVSIQGVWFDGSQEWLSL
ncbi:MAG: hypothetical protein KBC78_00625 [Candidatus Pacebacteria bacterium]|nr:hypothetical protein [Candidatus Paceibacterota bacterium]